MTSPALAAPSTTTTALDATEIPLRHALLVSAEVHAAQAGLDEEWLTAYRTGVDHLLQMLRGVNHDPDVRAYLNELARQSVPAKATDNLCACGGLMWTTPATDGDGLKARCDQCARTERWASAPQSVVVPLHTPAVSRSRPAAATRHRRG